MKPSPPARFRLRERWEEREAEGGIGWLLQLLLLLALPLELLRETDRWAGRSAGEQRLDECDRLHAEREISRRVAANAIDERRASGGLKKGAGAPA